MKTKLLKKIRKRFVIEYYPNGLSGYDCNINKDIFSDKYKYVLSDGRFLNLAYKTRKQALEDLIYIVKKKNKPIKVW